MKSFTFKIITQEKVVLEREVTQATLPIDGGEVTVLADHMPLIGALKAGEIRVRGVGNDKGSDITNEKRKDDDEEVLATSGGFVEFHDNILTILADRAERAEEIDIERAEQAKRRAEAMMQQKDALSDEEYARTAALLEKELTRLRVAKKHRTKHGLHIES